MKKLICLLMCAGLFASCGNMNNNNAANERMAANKAKMQRFYDEVMNAHNVNALDSFCTADFIDHNPDQGHSGKGIDDLKAGFKEFFSAYPDIHVSTNFMIAEGDTVMAYLTMTGTNSGPMGPTMPATNKKVSVEGMDMIAINGDKAAQRWGFFDSRKWMADLGMGGPPPPPADSPKPAEDKK